MRKKQENKEETKDKNFVNEEVKEIKKDSKQETKKSEENVKEKNIKVKESKTVKKQKKETEETGEENKKEVKKDSKKPVKNKKTEIVKENKPEINEEQLDKIKDEIKSTKEEKKANPKNQKIKKDILRNLLIGIIVTVYFIFIALGVTTIPVTEYALDLKTFAIFTAIISIIIFERAYKKDENYLALHGIEMILVGIETLVILQLYLVESSYFKNILMGIIIGMILYYIIKSIIIYIRSKSNKN